MAKRKDSRQVASRNGKPGGLNRKQQINGETLRAAVSWIASERIFHHLKSHGNTNWVMTDLVQLAIMWVWSDKATLTGAFQEAHRWSMNVLGRAAVETYQGLLNALVTWTETVVPLIWQQLHVLMERHGNEHWRVGLWLPLAVDGSRVGVPRTKSNEQAFCPATYGKGKKAQYNKQRRRKQRRKRRRRKTEFAKPQIWITLMWHMGLQMPWSWRSGPSNSSERAHFQQMLREQEFPENTLFCADAGFVGYELWKEIIDGGHSFLIRVGANVTLLRQLGYYREHAGTVYLWPYAAARKKQPPLMLRLLELKLGRRTVFLVTNVLSAKRLSDSLAIRLYRLRWGVEIQFRALKQTFGRRQLRSRTADRAIVELDWSLLGLWMIQLFAVKEQIQVGEVPADCSVSLAIKVVRDTFQNWSEHPHRQQAFHYALRQALKDNYKRQSSKQARYLPDDKDKPSAGRPKLTKATREHKALLKKYLNNAA